LEEINVSSAGGGGDSDGKVVHRRDDEGLGDVEVKGGQRYDEQEGRDGGALGRSNRDRGKGPGGPVEDETAGTVTKKGNNPLNKVRAYPFVAEEGEEGRGPHIVKPTLYVEEQGGDLVAEAMKGFDMMLQNEGSASHASPWQGTTLLGVDEGVTGTPYREVNSKVVTAPNSESRR